MTITVLDNMEYGSDAAAQAGYAVNSYHGEVSFSGGKTYHVFKESGIFQVKSGKSGNIEVLVVAAGGGGGGHSGGGGGGGGIQYDSSYPVSAGSYNITVGIGGMGVKNVYPYGYSGGNSVFGSLTAIGGGGGSSRDSGQPGQNGGCGGGASSEVSTGGTGSQGYNGGSGYNSSPYCAGGGGGCGASGGSGSSSKPGDGGVGAYYSDYDGVAGSPSGYFSGGGGGGVLDGGTGSTGGYGGGGNGVINSNGTAGVDNTGGGGGGGDRDKSGGNGGSGIVIISYDTDDDIGVIDNIDITSESQIISEGSYSLKIVAPLSYSENEYIFKTNTPPFDLSGYSYIIGKIRSDRTGSNIKLSLRQATGLITPSGGTATADSQFNSSFAPSYGCDGNSSTRWVSTNSAFPHWWKYDFGSEITKSIKRIGILKYSDPDGTQIKDFTVQGSNNDIDYSTIYTGTAKNCIVTDVSDTWEYFSFNNFNSYRYYKIIFNSSYRSIDRGSCFWDIQMSESEYIYHEITPNITAADTWQVIQFDISSVADANKDAIDQIIITVVNADADNTFYLDNFFAVDATDFAAGIQVSKAVGYAVLYPIESALNVSKVVAYAVLGPYVEPADGGPMMWIF